MNIFESSSKDKSYKAAPIPERLRQNKKVLMITANNTEDLEFFYPYYRLNEEGYTVDVATIKGGKFEGKHGYGLDSTLSIKDINPDNYELLYIPGGKAPAELRKDDAVLAVVREFALNGKTIAAICHGPQVLISAGLLKGKRIAAWPEIENEVQDAGAVFVNEALVIDGQFITARKPGDLHRHLWAVMDVLQGHPATKAAA